METEPKIVFESIGPSDAVRRRILDEIAHLEELYGRITACRVVVDKPEKGRRKGTPWQIRIHLTLPGGKEVAVSPSTARSEKYADYKVAIRDAFDAARRQLRRRVTRMRGHVKTHDVPQEFGNVARLFPAKGYGFIETVDGQEIYFHRNALVDADFAKLKSGDVVSYVAQEGEKGLQASTVHLKERYRPE
jgi:cold shock CspA family protein/ribosome-associated translation inhibitor RaiA